jgi:hypothetical protein
MNLITELDLRIRAFVELGNILDLAAESLSEPDSDFSVQFPAFANALQVAVHHNPWFIPSNIAFALKAWKAALNETSVNNWINKYEFAIQKTASKKIAVIMAGNIPLVGFHDFFCILIAGHSLLAKLSSDDKILLPAIAEVLCTIEPSFKQKIHFVEGTIKDFDAVIATGSNNTARYFEFYFSKYPNIIRKNRNGVAVLSGKEDDDTLKRLGADICTHFGLGCRNISKVFIPEGFDPKKLFIAIEPYKDILNNHFKYMNNHSYNSSVYLLNSTPHLDNGVFLLTQSEQYSSPIPVLYYEYYKNIETVEKKLLQDDEQIQCIASEVFTGDKVVPLGSTQSPGLADYADGIDTLKFLIEL